jgi:tRNA A-37 threonylcarbamoyl transferase component Bud32
MVSERPSPVITNTEHIASSSRRLGAVLKMKIQYAHSQQTDKTLATLETPYGPHFLPDDYGLAYDTRAGFPSVDIIAALMLDIVITVSVQWDLYSQVQMYLAFHTPTRRHEITMAFEYMFRLSQQNTQVKMWYTISYTKEIYAISAQQLLTYLDHISRCMQLDVSPDARQPTRKAARFTEVTSYCFLQDICTHHGVETTNMNENEVSCKEDTSDAQRILVKLKQLDIEIPRLTGETNQLSSECEQAKAKSSQTQDKRKPSTFLVTFSDKEVKHKMLQRVLKLLQADSITKELNETNVNGSHIAIGSLQEQLEILSEGRGRLEDEIELPEFHIFPCPSPLSPGTPNFLEDVMIKVKVDLVREAAQLVEYYLPLCEDSGNDEVRYLFAIVKDPSARNYGSSTQALHSINSCLGMALHANYMVEDCCSSEMLNEIIKNYDQIQHNKSVENRIKGNFLPTNCQRRFIFRNDEGNGTNGTQAAKTGNDNQSSLQRTESRQGQFNQLADEQSQKSDTSQLMEVPERVPSARICAPLEGNRGSTPQIDAQTECEVEESVLKSSDPNANIPVSRQEVVERYVGPNLAPASSVMSVKDDSLELNNEQEQIFRNMDVSDQSDHQAVRNFSYEEVEQATKGFDPRPIEEGGHKLGAGSFAEVFYGKFCDANGVVINEVAVKLLRQAKDCKESQLKLRDKQFPTELAILQRYSHPKIVRLLGQCKGPKPCLIFEYVPGPNLALLLAKDSPCPLEWPNRLNVLCDVADALKYLHTACPPVIHRDVKTANILLTDKCEGKLADFGLSVLRKEVPNPQASFCVSAAAGTKSYMPPEYFKGKVSPRLDIYSFGVVGTAILET